MGKIGYYLTIMIVALIGLWGAKKLGLATALGI